MKLQIDTTKKTIKIKTSVKLGDLTETLNRLLPDNEWKEFMLITSSTITNWVTPIIVEKIYNTPPVYPWITYSSTTEDKKSLVGGVYNVEY